MGTEAIQTDPLANTVRLGLIGSSIQRSRSPAMHRAAAEAAGVPLSYELLDLEQISGGAATLPALLARAQADGFAGLNITHPCKQAAIPLLDEVSPEVEAIGAVNTVVFRGGRSIGHNTDWSGFAEAFRRGLPDVKLASAVMLGAGGAGSAVAYAALRLGVERLSIYDIDAKRTGQLVERLAASFGADPIEPATDLFKALDGADGLINASPIGMYKYPGLPLPKDLLRPELWVSEVVYVPLETELVKLATERGCRVLDGGGMALFQAVDAFRLFTGLEPDVEVMRARLFG